MHDLPPPAGPPVDTSVPYVPPAQWHPLPPPNARRAPHPTLPIQAAVGAVVVLTVSLLASKYVLDALVGFEWPVVVYVVLLALVGYGPSLVWCKVASNRWGTGRVGHDLGLTPRWTDLAWGPLVWITAVGCQIVIGVIVLVLDIPVANNTDGITELQADRTYVVSIVITAVIAAPIVEELVFRGLVLRGLLSRMSAVLAVALQAVLFGLAHVDPVRGVGNIGLVLVLTGVGAAFGGAAYLLRRIGPTIVAHAIFNGVVLAIVLSGLADRLEEDAGAAGAPPAASVELVSGGDHPA
ncbi:MAG: CPBP family intramembrane glutamic endopeptidase [Ilumatobacteraceae bacterium]